MKPVLSAAGSATLDRAAEERGVAVADLMERAGWAVARAVLAVLGGGYGRRAAVVAGKGNNGGDGLVAARHLAARGVGVTVLLLAEPDHFREPAASNLTRLAGSGVDVRGASPGALTRALGRADVAVDAIFGTGFRGAPDGETAEAIEALNGAGIPVVAVDVPSGVQGDTGAVPGVAVRAVLTVALGAPKAGDLLQPGAGLAGRVEAADIGFPPGLVRSDLLLVEADDVAALLPVRPPGAHKRSTGIVLVVAGSRLMPGAASLVAAGAFGMGAGLVRLAIVPSAAGAVAARTAEGTFVAVPETEEGALGPGAWEALAAAADGAGALALGPGLTSAEATAAAVREVVLSCPRPSVVDADGLNAFAGRAGDLAARPAETVLTPHEGEFARLFGVTVDELREDRVALVRKAAAETGAVLLLKGPHSLVAAPDGEVRINPTGSAALATGGTGDVLTGATAALLARGLPALEAATVAAFVHGLAGERAGAIRGEATRAGDVADRLGAAALEVGR